MKLEKISAENFRTYERLEMSFADGMNLITGPNGIGKTNILEAIHYLCLTRSFASARDSSCVRADRESFVIRGDFSSDAQRSYSVGATYSRAGGKHIQVNKIPHERHSDHVGRFPIVVFSPDDYALTAEGPIERRRYLDNLLSQAYRSYLVDSVAYRKILKQRNSLLQLYPRPSGFGTTLDAWTNELVKYGSRLVHKRISDMSYINKHLHNAFEFLDLPDEIPAIEYQSGLDIVAQHGADVDTIASSYREALDDIRDQEVGRRRTLIGPHRDELGLTINGRPLRNYASQGQHRTFAMGLKVAQFMYLSDITEETPILLLDDAFDHLDPDRIQSYVQMINEKLRCQTFITTANPGVLDSCIDYTLSANARHVLERTTKDMALPQSDS